MSITFRHYILIYFVHCQLLPTFVMIPSSSLYEHPLSQSVTYEDTNALEEETIAEESEKSEEHIDEELEDGLYAPPPKPVIQRPAGKRAWQKRSYQIGQKIGWKPHHRDSIPLRVSMMKKIMIKKQAAKESAG